MSVLGDKAKCGSTEHLTMLDSTLVTVMSEFVIGVVSYNLIPAAVYMHELECSDHMVCNNFRTRNNKYF